MIVAPNAPYLNIAIAIFEILPEILSGERRMAFVCHERTIDDMTAFDIIVCTVNRVRRNNTDPPISWRLSQVVGEINAVLIFRDSRRKRVKIGPVRRPLPFAGVRVDVRAHHNRDA